MGNRTFLIAREGGREALSLSTVKCIVLLTLWFIILSCFLMLKQTALSLYICLTGLLFTQSGCTYQKFRAPARLALTLATCVPRESPNEPHSGPPLTTKPGPAKQTASERGTERSHQSNEQGFGAQTRSGTVQNTQCGYTFRK